MNLGKYKFSEWLLSNWPSVKILDFVKYVCNVEISDLEQKKIVLFMQMFSDKTFHLESVSTNLTYTT